MRFSAGGECSAFESCPDETNNTHINVVGSQQTKCSYMVTVYLSHGNTLSITLRRMAKERACSLVLHFAWIQTVQRGHWRCMSTQSQYRWTYLKDNTCKWVRRSAE